MTSVDAQTAEGIQPLQEIVHALDTVCMNCSEPEDLSNMFGDVRWWTTLIKKIDAECTKNRQYQKRGGLIAETIGQKLLAYTLQKYAIPGNFSALEDRDGGVLNMKESALRFQHGYNALLFPRKNHAEHFFSQRTITEFDMILANEKATVLYLIDFCLSLRTVSEKAETENYQLPIIINLLTSLRSKVAKLHISLNYVGAHAEIVPFCYKHIPIEHSYITAVSANHIIESVTDAAIEALTRGRLFSVFCDCLKKGVQ